MTENRRIPFESLPWRTDTPGLRTKTFVDGNKKIRLAEFSSEFREPGWCIRSHQGYVLSGELEIEFNGIPVRYPQGTGISIPGGASHQHKARSITPFTTVFLVEEA